MFVRNKHFGSSYMLNVDLQVTSYILLTVFLLTSKKEMGDFYGVCQRLKRKAFACQSLTLVYQNMFCHVSNCLHFWGVFLCVLCFVFFGGKVQKTISECTMSKTLECYIHVHGRWSPEAHTYCLCMSCVHPYRGYNNSIALPQALELPIYGMGFLAVKCVLNADRVHGQREIIERIFFGRVQFSTNGNNTQMTS